MPFIYPISGTSVFSNKRTVGLTAKSYFTGFSQASTSSFGAKKPNTYLSDLANQQPTARDVLTLRNQSNLQALSRVALANTLNKPEIIKGFEAVQSFQSGSQSDALRPPLSAFKKITKSFENSSGDAVDKLRPTFGAFAEVSKDITVSISGRTEKVLTPKIRKDALKDLGKAVDKIEKNIKKLENKPPTAERLAQIESYKKILGETNSLITRLENPNSIDRFSTPALSLSEDNFGIQESLFDPLSEATVALRERVNAQTDEVNDLESGIKGILDEIDAFPDTNEPGALKKLRKDLNLLNNQLTADMLRVETAEQRLTKLETRLEEMQVSFNEAKLQDTETFLINGPKTLLDLSKVASMGLSPTTQEETLNLLDKLATRVTKELDNIDPSLPHKETLEMFQSAISLAKEKFSESTLGPSALDIAKKAAESFPTLLTSSTTTFLSKQSAVTGNSQSASILTPPHRRR
ncbi:hypothetical protein SCG7109_BA_00070 [Chlamydiales bacterium SCGC AG-110-M15]|nr:hypothetical protein SCG7109_BA_00070 [Chlamydiales bacterium SCGC AG-110-M15]